MLEFPESQASLRECLLGVGIFRLQAYQLLQWIECFGSFTQIKVGSPQEEQR